MQPADPESRIILLNNRPMEDFQGLTPNEMDNLLYDAFGAKSPMRYVDEVDPEVFARIPFLRLTEELLKILHAEGPLKLTPKGALPRIFVRKLYGYRFIPEETIEAGITILSREADSLAVETAKIISRAAGLARVSQGKLALTKKGERLSQPDSRAALLKEILQAFTLKFNWGYHDRYPSQPVGQLGWGFTMYLLHRFGDEGKPMIFYADKYLQAFPNFLDYFSGFSYGSPHDYCCMCYVLRTFDRFLEWFGFVETIRASGLPGERLDTIRRTEAMEKLFRFE